MFSKCKDTLFFENPKMFFLEFVENPKMFYVGFAINPKMFFVEFVENPKMFWMENTIIPSNIPPIPSRLR